LMFFLVLKPQCTAKWHVFYIRNRHISVSSFVYKYDQWPHDSYMTGRAGVWEADGIVKFYIALLDFFQLLYKSTDYDTQFLHPYLLNINYGRNVLWPNWSVAEMSQKLIFDVSSGFYLWNVNRTTTWHL
jgi:hypothetical protein